MGTGICDHCEYWRNKDDLTGECTRFPQWIEIYWNHYCGEFKEKENE